MPEEPTGFALGLDAAAALERPGDILHAIFMTRTFALFDKVPADQLAEYLSGLLIGAEILSGAKGARVATVIGSAGLTARYVEAGARLGVEMKAAPSNCVVLGQLAVVARL